VLLLLKEIRPF